jgi:hypothetical protein
MFSVQRTEGLFFVGCGTASPLSYLKHQKGMGLIFVLTSSLGKAIANEPVATPPAQSWSVRGTPAPVRKTPSVRLDPIVVCVWFPSANSSKPPEKKGKDWGTFLPSLEDVQKEADDFSLEDVTLEDFLGSLEFFSLTTRFDTQGTTGFLQGRVLSLAFGCHRRNSVPTRLQRRN